MSNRLRVTLFVFVMISVLAISAEPVSALPMDYEQTNQVLDAGEYWYVYDSYTSGDTISGYFETHADTQGIKFFICDQANWDIWDGGGEATVYNLETNMHTLGFSFSVLSTDTWYVVFSNDAGSTTVTVDMGIDVNGDNTPRYSSSSYTTVRYAEVLENDEWYYVSYSLDAGDEISGHYSTFFTTDGIDFFIFDEANYNLWSTGSSATSYSSEDDMHQTPFGTFTVPTDGTWYCVFSAVDQSDTVTLSFGIDVDSVGATTSTDTTTTTGGGDEPIPDEMFIYMGLGFIGIIALLAICICIKKRKPGTPAQPFTDRRGYPPSGPTGDVRSSDEVILGALKSYPRVTMSELGNILGLSEDQVRRSTLKLIGSGAIRGTFDKNTDEFTSLAATSVGREMREDYRDAFELPRCPNCGAQLTKTLVAGETHQCASCGTHITG